MPPPSSTPAPRRFLISKKPTASSQDLTPIGPPRGPQQFRSTPRFATSSTPRPSTQAFIGNIRRVKLEDQINDALGSSPPSSPPRPVAGIFNVKDSIEIESELASDSQATGSEADLPSSKRRRISISPELEWETQIHDTQDVTKPVIKVEEAASDGPMREDSGDLESDGLESEDAGVDEEHMRTTNQQPTFQSAPRFKQMESDPAQLEGLPYAFSPQRRGARYITGGLASELQGWLSGVKGWKGDDRPAEAAVKLLIDEVNPGDNMYLVKGRVVGKHDDTRDEYVMDSAARVMLAGEGKLTGLGKRAEVAVGNMVTISQPVWEVTLEEQERWAVACDWAIMDRSSPEFTT